MTTPGAVLIGLATAAVMVLGWGPAPLRRLHDPPVMTWPGWTRPLPAAPPVRTRAVASLLLGVLVVILLPHPVLGPLAALAAGGSAFWALGRVEPADAVARRDQLVAELPSALDVLAACVLAGLPLRAATDAVVASSEGAVSEVLGRVGARCAAGFSDSEAWAALRDDPVLGSLARDLARASDAGTAVGALLARHAETARSAAQSRALAQARAVGVRTIVPVSLCYLPAFFLLGVVPVIAGVFASLMP